MCLLKPKEYFFKDFCYKNNLFKASEIIAILH